MGKLQDQSAASSLLTMGSIEAPSTMDADATIGQRVRSVSTETSSSSIPLVKPWTKASECKKKPTTLPNETVEYLKAWMMSPEHVAHPYPTEIEKAKIMTETGLELKQLTNWFVNNRKRYWKPRVEARLKDQEMNCTDDKEVNLLSSDESASRTTSSQSSDEPKRTSKRRSSVSRRLSQERERQPTSSPEPPVRLVEDSSIACISDGVTSSDDDDETEVQDRVKSTSLTQGREFCTEETVDVHILRPTGGRSTPELEDVTVLPHIPTERIARTFESCALTYRYPDVKKAQSRRDAEIVRMKKQYLASYLLETSKSADAAVLWACSGGALPVDASRKRTLEVVHLVPLTPRPKYRRRSVELWKEACQTADHVYDHDLPSLEEATLLFGYSS